MENPYIIPVKPEKDDYSTVKGDMRHWAGGAYTKYVALLADYENQLKKHRLWQEGNVAGKAESDKAKDDLIQAFDENVAEAHRLLAEQTEIVGGLVEALQSYVISCGNTAYMAPREGVQKAYTLAKKVLEKAKANESPH